MPSRVRWFIGLLLLLLIPLGSASADYSATQKLIFQDFPQNFPSNLPAQRYGTSVAIAGIIW